MRVYIGSAPQIQPSLPLPEGWRQIRQPGPLLAFLLAGLFFPCVVTAALVGVTTLWMSTGDAALDPVTPTPWGAIVLILILFVPAHELLHLVCHPEFGRSTRSALIIRPSKLQFAAYFEGCMSRTRWLTMRATPFIVLSVVPVVLLGLMRNTASGSTVSICLQVLFLANGLGSGADIVALLLVLSQVPPSSTLCFRAGKAYWIPGPETAEHLSS